MLFSYGTLQQDDPDQAEGEKDLKDAKNGFHESSGQKIAGL